MKTFHDAMLETHEAERDRLCAAEICIDEVLATLDRHGVPSEAEEYRALKMISNRFHEAFFPWNGDATRLHRMRRVRDALDKTFPLDETDVGNTDCGGLI